MVGANVFCPLVQKESVKLWFLLRVSRLMELGPADVDGRRDGLWLREQRRKMVFSNWGDPLAEQVMDLDMGGG